MIEYIFNKEAMISVEKFLYDILNETEKASIKHTEFISTIILTELEQTMHFSFEHRKIITPTAFMVSLLTDVNFSCRFLLIQLLEKYHVNERDLLLYLTTNLYSLTPGTIEEKNHIATLLSLPYIETISSEKNCYIIRTKYGTIEMQVLEDWLKKHKICFEPKKFNGFCHYAVESLAPLLPDDYITTSEFSNLFGGIYYHSYYTLKNGGVIDPARNLFYPGTCFEEIFKPNVLLQYPASELQERYQNYLKTATQKDLNLLDSVCALAMEQKRKVLK